jgi:cytochrome c oxidase subunit 3
MFNKSFLRLFITVFLGFYFLSLQYLEYCEAQFAIRDGVFGSTFFVATGFHGIHVLIGTLFLLYSLILLLTGGLSSSHQVSFELAS